MNDRFRERLCMIRRRREGSSAIQNIIVGVGLSIHFFFQKAVIHHGDRALNMPLWTSWIKPSASPESSLWSPWIHSVDPWRSQARRYTSGHSVAIYVTLLFQLLSPKIVYAILLTPFPQTSCIHPRDAYPVTLGSPRSTIGYWTNIKTTNIDYMEARVYFI